MSMTNTPTLKKAGNMEKSQKIKTAAMVLACVVLDIALHVVTAPFSTMPENASFGYIANILGKEITATLWALLAFSGVAFVFWNIQNKISGVGVIKGVRYGAATALIWIFAMLEGASLFGNSLINEFVVGLSDAVPVFVLSVLLSLLLHEKAEHDFSGTFTTRHKITTVSVFTGIFLTGRYIAYQSGVIESGSEPRPIQTFIWTLLMGITIGTAFSLLCSSNKLPLKTRVLKFGLLYFGVNWAVFLFFMPFLFSGYLADVFLRIIIDTTLVVISLSLTTSPSVRFHDIAKENTEVI